MCSTKRCLASAFSIALPVLCLPACSGPKPDAKIATAKQAQESPDEGEAELNGRDSKTPPSQRDHWVPSAPTITIADEAAERLTVLAKQGGIKPEHVVLIGVKEGGDKVFKNGGDTRYEYTLAATDDPIDWETHFSVESNGIKIAVRKDIAHFLDGLSVSLAQLDEGVRLRFDNPNVVRVMTSTESGGKDEPPASTGTPTPATLEPIPELHDATKSGRPENIDTKEPSVLRNPPQSD